MKGYKTSKDYGRLRELLDAGLIVPVVWYQSFLGRKVVSCYAAHKDAEYYYLGILTWAESYIKGAGWDFVPYCEARNIEFIEPQDDLL